VDGGEVTLVGEEYEAETWTAYRQLPPAPEGMPAERLREILEAVDALDQGGGPAPMIRAAERLLRVRLDAASWSSSLFDALRANELVHQLAELLRRPRALVTLVGDLSAAVERAVTEEEILAWLTLGSVAAQDGRPLLRPVVHAFVRGVGGAQLTFDVEGQPRLWLNAEDEEMARADGEARARFPVLTCTTCGQHYCSHALQDFPLRRRLRSPRRGCRGNWGRVAPARRVGGWLPRRAHRPADLPEDDENDGAVPRATPVWLCRRCGGVHPRDGVGCLACGSPGALVMLWAAAHHEDRPGKLSRCLACGANGREGPGGFREPARPVRAVAVSDVHVLAQDMVHHADRRRLLVFADNRQDAAFQAGWMRDHARRFRLRSLMMDRLRDGAASVGDLVAYLDDQLHADESLSRALIPEVWDNHPKDVGTRHAEQRRYYLRTAVLRELATSVNQRIGLEPWGRLRVRYANLSPEHEFVRTHAAALGLEPERLADGIALLLDQFRRGKTILHDAETRLFTRLWGDGDPEIMHGYFPRMAGAPRGLKLEREDADDRGRVVQWVSPGRETLARHVVKKWGVGSEHAETFARALWDHLTREASVLVPAPLVFRDGTVLRNTDGTWQVDAGRLLLEPHGGVWRCTTCRRAGTRPAPHDRCPAWQCAGTLRYEPESADNYDLTVLDRQVQMLRPYEHSAMVPNAERERLERLFANPDGDAVNVLVCTPTLELGSTSGRSTRCCCVTCPRCRRTTGSVPGARGAATAWRWWSHTRARPATTMLTGRTRSSC
jgi:hypothetical protein